MAAHQRELTMAETLYDLERMPRRDLLARYEEIARETAALPDHYREELARRNVSRVNNLLLLFTLVVTIATVAALYIAITA
jgi:hypothetical protein